MLLCFTSLALLPFRNAAISPHRCTGGGAPHHRSRDRTSQTWIAAVHGSNGHDARQESYYLSHKSGGLF